MDETASPALFHFPLVVRGLVFAIRRTDQCQRQAVHPGGRLDDVRHVNAVRQGRGLFAGLLLGAISQLVRLDKIIAARLKIIAQSTPPFFASSNLLHAIFSSSLKNGGRLARESLMLGQIEITLALRPFPVPRPSALPFRPVC